MFDLFLGLPLHPLAVHVTTVMLPLAALGTLVVAFVPRWRATVGPWALGAGILAAISLPVSLESGEALEERVGDPGVHAALAEQLAWVAIPMVILLGILVIGSMRQRRRLAVVREDGTRYGAASTLEAARGRSVRRGGKVLNAVAVLAVVAALATGVQTARVGHSGASAAWADQVSTTQSTTQTPVDGGDQDGDND